MPTAIAPKQAEKKPNAQHSSAAVVPTQFDLYAWLVDRKKFTPLAFFAGIIIAFACCSLAGKAVSKHNFYNNFQRFHDYINPASLYYPTISEMVSIVESKSTADQTVVIIGGNSVFYGMGQNESDLWSNKLQQDLGPKFAVFNFANPSADPFEWGYWTAECLLKKHRKVIYATIAMPGRIGHSQGSDIYGYAYWDAKEKNLLARDRDRDYKVKQFIGELKETDRTKMAELQMRSKLDSLLYFEDLWTKVGYSNMFTVWTHLTSSSPLKARKDYVEDKCYPGPVAGRFKSDADLASIRSYSKSYFELNTSTPRPSFWFKALDDMNSIIPAQFKNNCLVVVATHTPNYLDRLTTIERSREDQAGLLTKQTWQKAGFHSIQLAGTLNDEDFLDCRHLIASGGHKVAALVADQVQEISRSLKY